MKNFNLKSDTISRNSLGSIKQIVKSSPRLISTAAAFLLVFSAVAGLSLPMPTFFSQNRLSDSLSLTSPVKADGTYFTFSNVSTTLSLNITPSTTNLINTNNDWSKIPGVEGYAGSGLTTQAGVDPQTVLNSEWTTLPSPGNTDVGANKSNPNAVNNGGVVEFDTAPYFGIGFQGNVQNNPYLVFYLNTTGQTYLKMSYQVTDLDQGSNSSVSQIALQYRVGETGLFTNIPEGYIADATDGPNLSGRATTRSVTLPAALLNKPKVQIRLLTTDSADSTGKTTSDEWIVVNNVIITNQAPTAASGTVGGRATTASGRPLSGVRVTMQDSSGNPRTAITNPFGFYHFYDVAAGESYVFSAFSKRYVFSEPTKFLTVNSDYSVVNFVAQ